MTPASVGQFGRDLEEIMYSKILIPLDGSTTAEKVLPYARYLGGRFKIPIELLAVIEQR